MKPLKFLFQTLYKMRTFLIDLGLQALLALLSKKPDGKVAEFLFSDKLENTLKEVVLRYDAAKDEWEEINA